MVVLLFFFGYQYLENGVFPGYAVVVFAEESIEDGDFAVSVKITVGGMVIVPVGVKFTPSGITTFVADNDGRGGVFSLRTVDTFLEIA